MTVGFIGGGNMGAALARAVRRAGYPVYLYDKDKEKAAALQKELSLSGADSEIELCEKSDIVFLAVKPNIVESVLLKIKDALKKSPKLIISMAAGVKISSIEEKLGNAKAPIIRIMPNTPVAVMNGVIAYSKNELCTPSDEDAFLKILQHAGVLRELDESLLDAETAVAGCGPAFAYLFIDAIKEAGIKAGLSENDALLFAAKTVEGAAKMVLSSAESPKKLAERVCSPGGSTIEGVNALLDGGLYSLMEKTVTASFQRTKELGK